jgi:hypothetical protein
LGDKSKIKKNITTVKTSKPQNLNDYKKMVKLILWGIIAFVAYLYFSQKGLGRGETKNDILDDEDYTIVKIPKKKKKTSDDDFSDFDELK